MIRRAFWLALLAGAPAVALAHDYAIIAWTYTVERGDTVAEIAARMGVSPGDLARANGIDPDARLTPGTQLKRPDPNMPRSRTPGGILGSGHPPRRVAVQPPPSPSPAPVMPSRRAPFVPAPIAHPDTGTPHLVWPTSGAVVSRFAADVRGRPNNGIDLAAYTGMVVRAAAPGRVIFAGTEPERFGQLIVIDHGGGWATAYAYLGKVVVKQGEIVAKGTPIARIGTSGEAKKPSLHFELRHDNVPRDPLRALPIRL